MHRRRQSQQEQRVFLRSGRRRESLGILLGDKAGIEIAADKSRMREQRRLKRNVAVDAANHEGIERGAHFGDGIVAITAVGDELGNHRVVVHRDLATFIHARIDAYAAVFRHRQASFHVGSRWSIANKPAGGRQKIAVGILSIDAALDGPAATRNRALLQR